MAMAGQNEFAALARIAENGAAFAVAAPDPLTPGHANVVLRRDAEDWWDVSVGEGTRRLPDGADRIPVADPLETAGPDGGAHA